MFNVKIGPDPDVLKEVRHLHTDALNRFGDSIEKNVIPALEKDMADLLAPYPGPVVHPFEFATDRSRRFYFWIRKQQEAWRAALYVLGGATKYYQASEGYRRTHDLERGWRLRVERRLTEGYFIIANIAQDTLMRPNGGPSFYANYVYPPLNPLSQYRQVPGHARTGWGTDMQDAFDLIQEHGTELILDAWGRAVYGAVAAL